MPVWINRLIEDWLLPPGLLVVMAVVGVVVLRLHRRLGITLIVAAAALLYAFSTPLVSNGLMALVQTYPALKPAQLSAAEAGAVVVLTAGRNVDATEFGGGDTVSRLSLERARYGAFIHRRTGLPIVVSGGTPFSDQRPLGELMAESLHDDFGIDQVWVEGRSKTTYENAEFSARLLKEKGIHRVYLVSHAWHLPRAVPVFRQAGLAVIPAPTAFERLDMDLGLLLFMPNADDLHDSRYVLHELLGRLWYALRY